MCCKVINFLCVHDCSQKRLMAAPCILSKTKQAIISIVFFADCAHVFGHCVWSVVAVVVVVGTDWCLLWCSHTSTLKMYEQKQTSTWSKSHFKHLRYLLNAKVTFRVKVCTWICMKKEKKIQLRLSKWNEKISQTRERLNDTQNLHCRNN